MTQIKSNMNQAAIDIYKEKKTTLQGVTAIFQSIKVILTPCCNWIMIVEGVAPSLICSKVDFAPAACEHMLLELPEGDIT